MVNVLLLEIGDEVFVNKNKGGEIVGFYKIALSEESCFRTGNCLPGIYRDPALARVRMENGEVIDVYSDCLEAVDSEKYIERMRITGCCSRRFVGRFPEALFCERDRVRVNRVRPRSSEKIFDLIGEVIEGHRHRKPQMLRLGIDIGEEPESDLDIFFVVSINYHLNGLSADNSRTYNISDNPDNLHWHITVGENDLELLERGKIWKVYHKK